MSSDHAILLRLIAAVCMRKHTEAQLVCRPWLSLRGPSSHVFLMADPLHPSPIRLHVLLSRGKGGVIHRRRESQLRRHIRALRSLALAVSRSIHFPRCAALSDSLAQGAALPAPLRGAIWSVLRHVYFDADLLASNESESARTPRRRE